MPVLQTEPLEGFSVRLKIAGYGGIALATPVLLWQLWRFVTPGLYAHEKRLAIPFMVSALTLFVLGAGLAYYTLPRALEFLVDIGGTDNFVTAFQPGKYFSLITYMMLAFGIGFEFPILLVFLQLAGILDWLRDDGSSPTDAPAGQPLRIVRRTTGTLAIDGPGAPSTQGIRLFGLVSNPTVTGNAISGSGPGILGEALTAALNVNAMLWRTGPAATELEEVTLGWLMAVTYLSSCAWVARLTIVKKANAKALMFY